MLCNLHPLLLFVLFPNQVVNLPPPFGSCGSEEMRFYTDSSYSIAKCKSNEETEYVDEKCGCRDFYQPDITGNHYSIIYRHSFTGHYYTRYSYGVSFCSSTHHRNKYNCIAIVNNQNAIWTYVYQITQCYTMKRYIKL